MNCDCRSRSHSEWMYGTKMDDAEIAKRIQSFQALHKSGCFVLPNPWDAGSAVFLEKQGFKAPAMTSAGFAFLKGLPDSVSALSRDAIRRRSLYGAS
ncbi:MAG: isocitrate lyase/phosphoenolpyruvate mutase family protein [Bacteroidota bacterium]